MKASQSKNSTHTVRLKLVDSSLPVPTYQTSGSVGFDLYSRIDIEIQPFTPTLVPTNVIVEAPKKYFLMLSARSSLPLKKNLMMANSVGIVDQDYCGDSDELKIQLLNFSQSPVTVTKGERIAQGTFMKVTKPDFQIVESMDEPSRGGFGSTEGYNEK